MTTEDLKTKITEMLPAVTFQEGTEWPTIQLAAADWHTAATILRTEPALYFDYLFCLTCIDFKTNLTMVYHLDSMVHNHVIVVKCILDNIKPEIDTVSDIWKTADFHEREVYEMFGVNFLNHPDLRLLILPDGWEGKNPLRKDFEDAVNMIKL
jgi:NADH-quinone oxidoreductase subunit C